MGRTKELLEGISHEDQAIELYARMRLLRECQEDLIDPDVPETMKRIILKAILA